MNYKQITGKQLIQGLEESSYNDLEQNIINNFVTNRRQNAVNEVVVNNITYTPFENSGILQVDASVRSNQHNYKVTLQFQNVVFGEGPTSITITSTDGETNNLQPISIQTNDIKVKCNCLDFFWRFAYWNANDKSLVGEPPALYKRRTNRPPVNAARVPGICRHIIKVVDELTKQGIVK
jgi:hypothetical protein